MTELKLGETPEETKEEQKTTKKKPSVKKSKPKAETKPEPESHPGPDKEETSTPPVKKLVQEIKEQFQSEPVTVEDKDAFEPLKYSQYTYTENGVGVARKLVQVYGRIKNIKKTGHNDFQNYDYTKEEDVLETLRPTLYDVGLAVIPSVKGVDKQAYSNTKGEGFFITRVQMEYLMIDMDTGDYTITQFIGEGQDKADKGIYKAYTGANKYFLTKTFHIVSGDDDPEFEKKGTFNHNANSYRQQYNYQSAPQKVAPQPAASQQQPQYQTQQMQTQTQQVTPKPTFQVNQGQSPYDDIMKLLSEHPKEVEKVMVSNGITNTNMLKQDETYANNVLSQIKNELFLPSN
jgi:hypothetical protein